MNYFYLSGVYSFSVGCLAFTWDAVTTRPVNRKYLAGCFLFDIGCLFFTLDAHEVEMKTNKTQN